MKIIQITLTYLIILAFAKAELPTKCPTSFAHVGNSCYTVFDVNVTWIDAQSYCNTFGSDLLRIDTQQEMTSVRAMLLQHVGKTAPSYRPSYWLDANDLLAEGDWRYSGRDGDKLPYTHWALGHPINTTGNEDCCVYRHHTGLWEATDCEDKHVNVVCEIQSKSLQTGKFDAGVFNHNIDSDWLVNAVRKRKSVCLVFQGSMTSITIGSTEHSFWEIFSSSADSRRTVVKLPAKECVLSTGYHLECLLAHW